jgi:hypothetical protein
LSQLEKDFRGPSDHGESCPDHGTGVNSSHTGKESAATKPEGAMGCALISRQHQSDFKNTIVKIFFSFHLGNGLLIINVTQNTFPLTVEFDACHVHPCGDLMSQLQP